MESIRHKGTLRIQSLAVMWNQLHKVMIVCLLIMYYAMDHLVGCIKIPYIIYARILENGDDIFIFFQNNQNHCL